MRNLAALLVFAMGLTLFTTSCRHFKESNITAELDRSERAFFFARIIDYSPVTVPDASCVGALCNVKEINLQSIDNSISRRSLVDTNSRIDDDRRDTESKDFLENAVKGKAYFAFEIAAYNGPNESPTLLRIETSFLAGTITSATERTDNPICDDKKPLCRYASLELKDAKNPDKTATVDLTSETQSWNLAGDFTVKNAIERKMSLAFATSKNKVGAGKHPLLVLIGPSGP